MLDASCEAAFLQASMANAATVFCELLTNIQECFNFDDFVDGEMDADMCSADCFLKLLLAQWNNYKLCFPLLTHP